MKSNMKKFLALFLSLSLVLATFGDFAQVKAADSYTNVTLTETSGWDTWYDGANNQWVLYLKGNGYTSTDWAYKYKGFTIECNGVIGTTNQVSSADGDKLYCTIPSSLVPAKDGAVFTIKAGQYEPDDAGTTSGLNILNDFTVVAVDGRLVHTTFIDEYNVEPFDHATIPNTQAFYFATSDLAWNKIGPDFYSWTNFLSPAYCDGTRIDTAGWTSTYSGVLIDGQPMDYWGAHFKYVDLGTFYIDGLSAVAGTTVTVKGLFASSTQDGWNLVDHFFLKELNFKYDGSAWSVSRPVEYKTVDLAKLHSDTAVVGEDWQIHINTDNFESKSGCWDRKYVAFNYECNGVAGTATAVSEAGDNRLWCKIPTSAISADSGTVLTIKAGDYAPLTANTRYGIRIAEDYDIVLVDGGMIHTTILEPAAVETFDHATIPNTEAFYFSLKDANENGIATGVESWTNFLSPGYVNGTRIDTDGWTTTYSGVFIDGQPMDYWGAHFKNVDLGTFYIDGLTAVAGTKVTVKGLFISSMQDGWKEVGSMFLPELTFTYDGSTWSATMGKVYTEYTGTPEFNMSDAIDPIKGFYFFGGETKFPYAENWSYTSYAEDNAESGVFLSTDGGESYTKTTTRLKKVQQNLWYVCLSDVGVTPATGNIIMVKGAFIYDDAHRITFSEAKFIWNGSAYEAYEEYKQYEGTPVFQQTGKEDDGFYFSAGETAFPYDSVDWTIIATAEDTEESGVFLNGEKTDVFLKKVGEDMWYVCMSDAEIILENGDEITIAGSFVYQNHRITFEEASFTFNGTAYEGPTNGYNGIPELLDINNYGLAAGFYFSSQDGAPYAEDWTLKYTAVDGEENGVFVNGTKTAIYLKKTGTDTWHVCIDDAGVTLNEGDVLTIAGAFQANSDVVTFTEASFEFTGKHFSEGEYEATEFTITGLAYSDIKYVDNHWNMYFTLSAQMPGEYDKTYFPYMTYEIDGTEYTTHWFKSGSAHTVDGVVYYNLYFPIEQLPETFDKEYTVTVKAGTAQGRVPGTNEALAEGIKLTEDYQFVVGGDYEASAPTIDYTMGDGGSANGIYLSSGDAFPTIGWDYNLTKVGEGNGIYVNGSETEVFIKKYANNQYYVCLSDMGVTAEEGTIVMLKGAFTTAGLNKVTFKTAKYIYTGGAWKVYTVTEVIESTGTWGDATADSNLKSNDLVRVKLYLASEKSEIGLYDADLNGSGNIDSYDAYMVRRLLVDDEYYRNGYNVKGVPTYEDNQEMRLAAYVSPTLEEGFTWYKEAGFTTLLGENRAKYGYDGFDEYMNAAKAAGLDVLVQTDNAQLMGEGTMDFNAATLKTDFDNLKNTYDDTFRGYFLGDEPDISQLESYTKVMDTLNSLNQEVGKDMFLAHHPIYTDEAKLWADNSLSLNEKYAKYTETFGSLFDEFMYDFYPFRYKYNWKIGSYINGEDNYVNEDWFNNLEIVAQKGHGNFKTGITVQSYAENINPKDHYRDITEADVSFQVYSALAYGMKSVTYFTYDEHWDSSVGTTSCMIYNGQRTDTYYAVQAVNEEIKALDHILLNYNWQGTLGITGDNNNAIMNHVNSDEPVYKSSRISAYSASNDAIIGCLKDLKGYDGFMIVNATDPSESVSETGSVTFKDADHAKVYINGVEHTVALNNGTYEYTLAPGQGIFVIPYIQ